MSGYDLDPGTAPARRVQARYARESAEARKWRPSRLDLPYGEDPRHRFDLFAADETPSPVIVFFHGGYWTAGDKDARGFPASAWARHGSAWCPVRYRLAPAADIAQIVRDARRAVETIARQAPSLGLIAGELHLAGNSAGAHLAAMAAAADWSDTPDLTRPPIRSLTAVSGLFDLEPLFEERPNGWLRADAPTLRANSPLHRLPLPGTDVVVSWGVEEPREFEDQSRDYAAACRANGLDCREIETPGVGHFEIIAELGRPEGALFRAMARGLERAGR